MEQIEHFSHDHPLILMVNTAFHADNADHGGGEVYCYACVQPISEQYYYGCSPCLFFLHKSCAQLPREITYHSFPGHPFTLLSYPRSSSNKCVVCEEDCSRFFYHCSSFDFDIDIKCASMAVCFQQRIEYTVTNHQHQLIPLTRTAIFMCDACGSKHEGASFLCTTCGFWANQKCVSSPITVQLSHQNHHSPLTLSLMNFWSEDSCGICDKRVNRGNWVYYCWECKYIAHINCATSEAENCKMETESSKLTSNTHSSNNISKVEIKIDDALRPNLIALPSASYQSVRDLLTQFIKDMSQQGKYKEQTEIRHVSHDHPLIFVDNQINQEHGSCSGTESNYMPLSNDKPCNGCAIFISTTPFYYCTQCNFFLHEWCAELPDELRHPCHPQHPLLLTASPHYYQRRLTFDCSDCHLYLDIWSASLPRTIIHEAHKHTLAVRPVASSFICNACDNGDNGDYGFAFMCDPCNHKLCIFCALLPRNLRHRYDKHPFTLTYSPVKNRDPDEDFCELCLEELNPKLWFYHCASCDQSLHVECIFPF